MRLYLDAAPIIYSIERVPVFGAAVDQRLGQPGLNLIASSLTRMECRVKPLRQNDQPLLLEYEAFFSGVVSELVELSNEVIERATEIRAKHGFKTPDAIHLAAAVASQCDASLTNDQRLVNYSGLKVETLQP